MEHLIVKVVCQALAVCLIYHVIRQQSDSPCAALAGCFHNVNRSVNSACKDSLSDTFCLEQTAMSQHLVQFYMFFLKKDIHTCLKSAERCIQMYSHKVCQVKFALR